LRWTEFRYFEIAPTFGAIDISLSLSTTMMSRSDAPALFSPSYASPRRQRAVAEDGDDLESLVAKVAPDATPSAAEIAVAA
jgi:hypothetical protein